MDTLICVQTTVSSKQEAEKIINDVLAQKLAACIQTWPVTSYFSWKDKPQKEEEYLIQFKLVKSAYTKLHDFLLKHHPYECPEVISFDLEQVSDPYLNWANSQQD